jgi:hypothetical protein
MICGLDVAAKVATINLGHLAFAADNATHMLAPQPSDA